MADVERRAFGRREFLVASTGIGAGLAAASRAARAGPPAKGKWRMRLSTSTIQYSKVPIEQACERIAALGFEGVDIWSGHAGCPHLDDVQSRLGAEGLKELLARTNLTLYSFSVYRGGYRRYAKLLGEAGGGVAIHGSAGRVKPDQLIAAMTRYFERLKPEIELAEKYNSYVAVENHGGALLNSLDSFRAFVEYNPAPGRVGIALAPYHLQRIKASVPEAVAIAGEQLLFFYAWQAARGTGQLPGHGPVDFTPWLAALAKIDYPLYVNPFMHHEPAPDAMDAALARSCDYLTECHAKATK
ncbi:MAG: sugar phosphate isomerase/epimerase family protein [Planctomycetota bacterium]|jgi:sugar phosphate isomerase/epimerase